MSCVYNDKNKDYDAIKVDMDVFCMDGGWAIISSNRSIGFPI